MHPLMTKLQLAGSVKTKVREPLKAYSCGQSAAQMVLDRYLNKMSIQQVKQEFPGVNLHTLRRIWKDHQDLLGNMLASDLMLNHFVQSKGKPRGRKKVLVNGKLAGFTFEVADLDRLKVVAKKLGKSKSNLMRKALGQLLSMYEDMV